MWIDESHYLVFLIRHQGLDLVTVWACLGVVAFCFVAIYFLLLLRLLVWTLGAAVIEATSKTTWVVLVLRKARRLGVDLEPSFAKEHAFNWVGFFQNSIRVQTGAVAEENRPVKSKVGGAWYHPFKWTLPTPESAAAYLESEKRKKADDLN